MKNKNGFTLVELLAVIAILALLVLIVSPMVTKFVINANNYSKETILKNAEDAAVNYALENSKKTTFISNNCAVNYIVTKDKSLSLPSGCNKVTVRVDTLINQGYYKDDSNKLKKNGIITIYKYKYTNSEGKELYDLKAYASESILN